MTPDPHADTALLHQGARLDEASLAVILLHGRGSSAKDILSLGSAFALPGSAYLAPQAAGHTWYPFSFLAPREANEPFLTSALARIDSIVRTIEQAGIPRERVVISGFSQGACLSTEYVATHPARYAGLIAFTGGLIGPPDSVGHNLGAYTGSELAGTPAMLLSGDPDPHVPWSRIEESGAVLGAMGATVTTKCFPGRPHSVSAEEIKLARGLLLAALERSPVT